MNRPIRVLNVSGGKLDYGGISTVMLNYAARMDPSVVRVDFLVHGFDRGPREDEAEAMGARVLHVPYKVPHYFANRRALLQAFGSGGYDVVHAHMDGMNGYALALAKRAGVPVRISHCHNTQFLTTNPLRMRLHRRMAGRILSAATALFACSEAAGRFLYGDAAVDAGKLVVIKNAVALERFRFDPSLRAQMRAQFDLNGRFVVCHIGRFDYQKNQEFLLQVLMRLRDERPETCLLLVGDGAGREALQACAGALGLTDWVRFPGFCPDIPALLAASDTFVLPSRFEGLGIVLIEAQASGLSCIASDAVPRDTDMGACRYLPLTDEDAWLDALAHARAVPDETRLNTSFAPFEQAGYDIAAEARLLQNRYVEMVP